MNNRVLSNSLDFDFLSREEKKTIHQALLYRLFQHSIKHPLTQNRFSKLNKNVTEKTALAYLGKIIPENTENHQNLIKENFTEITSLTGQQKSALVFSSGGTESRPTATCVSFEEVLNNARFQGKAYFTAGIRAKHTVATFGVPTLLSSEFTVYHGLRQTSCLILPIGIVDDAKKIVRLIEDFSANVLLVMPSDLIPILQYLESYDKKLPQIQLVVTGGERLRDDLKKRIKKRIGSENLKFRSTFQTSDTGAIGFQCDFLDDGEYHVHEELQFVEITEDKESKNTLVVTNLDRYLFPVIRLNTGDLAEWKDAEHCACGRSSRIIKLLGRKSRYIKVGGEKFDQEIFHSIPEIFKIPIEACAWRLRINKNSQEELVFRVRPDLMKSVVKGALNNALCKANPKFSYQLSHNIVALPKLEALHKTDIVYSNSGKRKILIDERSLSK